MALRPSTITRGILANHFITETKVGSDCNGSSGDASRVLTLANASISSNEKVYVDRQRLKITVDYTVSHLAASSTITFVGKIWDTQAIIIDYFI